MGNKTQCPLRFHSVDDLLRGLLVFDNRFLQAKRQVVMGTNADLGTYENEDVSVVPLLLKMEIFAHMRVIVHADEIESCTARACPYLFYCRRTVGIKGMDMKIPHVFMFEHEIA